MTQLHAGGKFGGDDSAYAVSGGLHGVGVSVVNALSIRLEVEISIDGSEWYQTYDRSVPGTLKQGDKTKKTGTTVRFWADPGIFETTNYDFETVARRLQEMAFLNKGLTINLTDERVTREEVVDEVVSDTAEAPKSAEKKPPNPLRRIRLSTGRSTIRRHWSISSSTSTGPRIRFTPASSTFPGKGPATRWKSPCSGTAATRSRFTPLPTPSTPTRAVPTRRVSGAALTTVVNKYAKDKKLLKDKDPNLTGDDIFREGLAAVISVKVSEPQFEGQTKTEAGSTEVKSFVQKS